MKISSWKNNIENYAPPKTYEIRLQKNTGQYVSTSRFDFIDNIFSVNSVVCKAIIS